MGADGPVLMTARWVVGHEDARHIAAYLYTLE